MGLFDSPPPRETAAIGRTHNVLAEVHYEDGSDDWWYQGRLVVADAGFVEAQWDPEKRSWEFRPETAQGPEKTPIEWYALAPGTTEPRPAQRRVRMAHRIYYFEDVDKADRRYLHTADLDLIQSAPQVPYNKTDKGAARFQMISFAAMGAVEALTLLLMVSMLSGVNATTGTAEIGTGFFLSVAQVIGWPISLLAVYYLMGRRTLVITIDLRPLATRIGSPKNELVYLTNSHKEPAAQYLRRVFGLPSAAVEGLAKVVSLFESEAVQRLQEELKGAQEQLDKYKLAGSRGWEQGADLAFLTQAPGVTHRSSWLGIVIAVALSSLVTGLLVYAAFLSGV